jgi:hypothetical protein
MCWVAFTNSIRYWAKLSKTALKMRWTRSEKPRPSPALECPRIKSSKPSPLWRLFERSCLTGLINVVTHRLPTTTSETTQSPVGDPPRMVKERERREHAERLTKGPVALQQFVLPTPKLVALEPVGMSSLQWRRRLVVTLLSHFPGSDPNQNWGCYGLRSGPPHASRLKIEPRKKSCDCY